MEAVLVFDKNWELINGQVAHEIEVLNLSTQANVIEATVRFFIHQKGGSNVGCPTPPSVAILKELHRTATYLLLERPGEFRDIDVHVKGSHGYVFEPPPPQLVAKYLEKFHQNFSEMWNSESGGNADIEASISAAIEVGSYALWMVNWIHPFRNGNGRTARAYCYTSISMKLGFVLPGYPTIIDLIMNCIPEYHEGLSRADEGYAATGSPNLSLLKLMIERLLIQQLESLSDEAS
jgi:Fic family protein